MWLWNALDGVTLEEVIRLVIGTIASIGLFLYAFKIKNSNKEIWRYFVLFYLSDIFTTVPTGLIRQLNMLSSTKTEAAFVGTVIAIVISLGLPFLNFIALWRYSESQQWVESKMKTWR
jgi:hypothetical protein